MSELWFNIMIIVQEKSVYLFIASIKMCLYVNIYDWLLLLGVVTLNLIPKMEYINIKYHNCVKK